jgi:3',5'-cyclic AMP phosphodiesterase CpdA
MESPPVFRIAHLSDPHLGPLPRVKLRELAGKRLTGYLNYRRNRSSSHDMQVLCQLMNDLLAQKVDHIVHTGDVVNIGLNGEFAPARAFLERLGTPQQVSFVPGNHDAYVKGAFENLTAHIGDWMKGDETSQGVFPYVRIRGNIAFLGLSSGVPTPPFMAYGIAGETQLKHAAECLSALQKQGFFRIVLIHHPPYTGISPTRGLKDASAFEAMLKAVGCELVLHGHEHKAKLTWREGLHSNVPILGAPSASASLHLKSPQRKAGYHLIEVQQHASGEWTMEVTLRQITASGDFKSAPVIVNIGNASHSNFSSRSD